MEEEDHLEQVGQQLEEFHQLLAKEERKVRQP
jgi:hypothetical protein